MERWKRRGIAYLAFVIGALLATARLYQWGMSVFEDDPVTFVDAFQFAVEMFTTTGFGGDAPWESAEMLIFIAVTDLLGMALLVGALPVLVAPLLENALSTSAPQRLDDSVSDHVVVCSRTTRADELVAELESNDVPFVIVESDRKTADALYADGQHVVRADPESTEGLRAARLPDARALFVDVSDEIDASIVLAATELAEDVPVVSVVEDPARERYHRLAGAEHVLSPRTLLGESLATKVTTASRTSIDEAIPMGDRFELAEISIRHGSELSGRRIADSDIREEAGVSVIGAWIRGEYYPTPDADLRLAPGTVLLVSGRTEQLDRLVELTQSPVRSFSAGNTVVVGYGEVGEAVATSLSEVGIPHTVVDEVDGEGVDVVGDATKPETLQRAGIDDATTVILALPDDTITEFATLVVRDIAPDVEIIARVQEQSNVSKTYRAGADYVLSLATVTGRMAASTLLEGREVLSVDKQVQLVRTGAPGLVGRTLGGARVRDETGCTVIAIERDTEVVGDLGPDTRIEAGDELIVAGTDEGIRAFERSFGSEA